MIRIISTFAGTPGSQGYTGDDDSAASAKLNWPQGLAFNNEGELLIADGDNYVIRKVDETGIISTMVTGLNFPVDVTVGRDGELFIADNGENRQHQITKFDNNGFKIRVAGIFDIGYSSDFHRPENALLAFVSSVSVLSVSLQ